MLSYATAHASKARGCCHKAGRPPQSLALSAPAARSLWLRVPRAASMQGGEEGAGPAAKGATPRADWWREFRIPLDLEARLEQLEARAGELEAQVGRLEAGAVATRQRIQELEARVEELEQLVEASLEPCGVSSSDQEGE